MKKVKITVLKTTFDRELALEYVADGLDPCPMLNAGQIFYADYTKPDGLCDEAWKAIDQYVFSLAHGAGDTLFYYGDWIRTPGVVICSCNDGLRPVIFKPEATYEEAVLNDTPVAHVSLRHCTNEKAARLSLRRHRVAPQIFTRSMFSHRCRRFAELF